MIYIQSNPERTLPHHFDAACAMYGVMDSNLNYRLTSFEEVRSGKFDNLIRTHLFVGSVEFMREVFNRVGKSPSIINSDRSYFIMRMDDVRKDIENGKTWFVKPFQMKLISSGLVVDKYSISSLHELPNDLEVMVYPVLPKILSEWRVYILNNRIEDIRNYSGDFMVFPDIRFIQLRMKEYSNELPSSYVMDVGICSELIEHSDGHVSSNCIIEFNDMYAIGNYGVPNDLYLRMLRTRYFEIMRSEDSTVSEDEKNKAFDWLTPEKAARLTKPIKF